jgi:hypothetical protein
MFPTQESSAILLPNSSRCAHGYECRPCHAITRRDNQVVCHGLAKRLYFSTAWHYEADTHPVHGLAPGKLG